jgi:hypothetical protein
VSLLHVARGYHVEHAFHVNALVFVAFVFTAYRLAKSLAGETYGLVAALLVGAHGNVLLAARSGGFDLLATFLTVSVVQAFVSASRECTPQRVVVVVLRLCLLANVRYEGTALLVLGTLLLVGGRLLTWRTTEGYRWLYSGLPLLLLPRYWQSLAKANDAEQPLSASLFGFEHFWNNTGDFLSVVADPLDPRAVHSPLVVALGLVGLLALGLGLVLVLRRRAVTWHGARTTLFVLTVVSAEIAICFAYFWGKPLHPASVRLFVWLDAFLGFTAAWALTLLGRWLTVEVAALRGRSAAPVSIAIGLVLFAMALPVASEARLTNSLTLTRQAAVVWRYFATLGHRRFVVLTDRPGMFTVFDYGAVDITSVKQSRSLLYEQSRHLFDDIYLIQEVNLATHRPEAKFDPWPDVPTETVLEFQNAENGSVRVARVVPAPGAPGRSPPRHREMPDPGAGKGKPPVRTGDAPAASAATVPSSPSAVRAAPGRTPTR